jgi:hypothetical protein
MTNFDKDESISDHIMEFIKTNNHTNIVLANVPFRYVLSYHSQVNKGIRSDNKKLMEIAKERKQVALIEINIDRKYHTRHGLHFNKLGKLLFSQNITHMIYSILGNKQEQSTVMSENYEIQGNESEVVRTNTNERNKVWEHPTSLFAVQGSGPSSTPTRQAKPSQSSNWGRRLARSASRRPPVC